MKITLPLFALGLAVTAPAHAQLFTPATVGGAALGAVAGGVIGNNSGSGDGQRGAIIGAVAGGLIGSAVGRSYRERADHYAGYPTAGSGHYYYASGDAHEPPAYHHTPAWARPSRTATTTLLGGVAGAVIGHNNGRRTLEGAAIGAGAGYLLGRITEPRYVRKPAYVHAPYRYYRAPVVVTAPPAPAPSQITIINNYYVAPSTPMGGANAMFGR